jgi:hypothetical protein
MPIIWCTALSMPSIYGQNINFFGILLRCIHAIAEIMDEILCHLVQALHALILSSLIAIKGKTGHPTTSPQGARPL